jgi:site-specific recombinase XerD
VATTDLAPRDSLPAILQDAGNAARFAAEEFFEAKLSNEHTRRAYGRYVRNFLASCEADGLALRQITPADAARFIRDLEPSVSTQKVALAALRRFFDLLVTRHVVLLNPFASVRGPRQPAEAGRTPEITVPQARRLLDSIDTAGLAGLRDRAVIGTLTYTGARVGALSLLRLQDLRDYGDHRTLCFREKGGKRREIPVRIDLDRWLADYLAAGRIADDPKDSPLLRPLDNRDRSRLIPRVLSPQLIRELLKRRLRDAGLPEILTPHSFRVMVVTDLLTQDVPIEDVQYLAGHSHPSTTQVYDRRAKKITRNIVERISV